MPKKEKKRLSPHYHIQANKIEVIDSGVDLETYHPKKVALYRRRLRQELKISAGTFVIFSLGSGFRQKGLDRMIAAFAEVKKKIPQAIRNVAGKDRIQGYLRKARRLGVGPGVICLGPTQRATELCAANDLFALPTLYDPFRNACPEAMATGIPVLATTKNGFGELVVDQQNGFLVHDPKNHWEISEKNIGFLPFLAKKNNGEKSRIIPVYN